MLEDLYYPFNRVYIPFLTYLVTLVPLVRLELTRLSTLDPKSRTSTNFAIEALDYHMGFEPMIFGLLCPRAQPTYTK